MPNYEARAALRDFYEGDLEDEITRRVKARLAGLCDYCEGPITGPPCAQPFRHTWTQIRSVSRITLDTDPAMERLLDWLRSHPLEFQFLAKELNMPLPTCEGFSGECGNLVLWRTSALTAYEWKEGTADPNRDLILCPQCSAEYTEHWQEQWREYYSGQL